VAFDVYDESCVSPHATNDGEGKGGLTRVTTGQGLVETVTLCLKGEKNGCVTFPIGTCIRQCTADPKLPNSIIGELPPSALDTIYIRVINHQGESGNGSYTVCFENPDMQTLYIYKFAEGAWVLVRSGSTNPLCTLANGSGAFYLGLE
jgi:hypothetical protein